MMAPINLFTVTKLYYLRYKLLMSEIIINFRLENNILQISLILINYNSVCNLFDSNRDCDKDRIMLK